MKKFILFALLISAAFVTHAQVVPLISSTNSTAVDTVTDTGVKVMYKSVVGNKATITIQVNLTKISGTVGGTVIPVWSNDAVKWYAAGSGTFTPTNVASQGTMFAPPLGAQYYGVQWTGTGTMAGKMSCTILSRTLNQ